MTKVSVCISTFNRLSDLKKCVDSILMQDYPDFELVIYDNASSDGSAEYLHSIESDKIRVFCKTIPNKNAMETLNYTFNAAYGEYILVMDDDAYLPTNDVISRLATTMDKYSNVAIVGSNVCHLKPNSDGHLSQMPIRKISGDFMTPTEIFNLGIIEYYEFHGACALFRKSMVQEVGIYDNSFTIYINEFDLAGKMMARGYDVLFDSSVIAIHTERSSSTCNLKHKYYIRNFNTCITRNFRGTFNRLKTVMIRTPMLYMFWYIRSGWKCSMFVKFKFGIITGMELIRAMFRSFFPDQKNVFKDQWIQSYLETSMYNSFKLNIINYIQRKLGVL